MATFTLSHLDAPLGATLDMGAWMKTEPQGAEDKQLRVNVQNAAAHWQCRAEFLLGAREATEDHVSVPLKPIKKVRVTYRHVGPRRPAPYSLDE
jgi:hypothetical protein